ncbi:putative phage tail protein [Vibrio paucivorans]
MTHDDYHRSYLMLLPEGAAWSKDSGALFDLSLALTKAYERVDASNGQLEQEIFPETCYALLPDYEHAFGLPECQDLQEQTFDRRRQAVYAKDTHQGGLSPWALEALCASYGFDVEILPVRRHHCLRPCTHPINPYDSQFDILARVKSSSAIPMTVLDDCTTPLLQFDELAVTCLLDKYIIGGWQVIYVFEEE